MLKPTYDLPPLPPKVNLETPTILRALTVAHRALAELKGRADVIPNQGVLIDTLVLQEAMASSQVENIVTTHDELFQADLLTDPSISPAAKEVALYRVALKHGHDYLVKHDGILPNRLLISMFGRLLSRSDGFRETPGTQLRNDRTGATVYVPPQDSREIVRHMSALELFINDDALSALDPLIKMSIIHHQFESIHPFPDGNGRIGRILNVLYLVRTRLLDIPILYLSRHITSNKADYYRLLQAVRDERGSQEAWEAWNLFMIHGVEKTSRTTLDLVEGIRSQIAATKKRMRSEHPNLYSQDVLNNIFRHPYTRIEFMMRDLGVTRQTAARKLDTLAQHGFLRKLSAGRNNYYINEALVRLFISASQGNMKGQ